MKPQKFIQSFKCECFQPYNYCTCSQKIVASKTLIDNVSDIAESLIEVMTLCGIHLMRAKLSYDVVIYYFLHFEELMHRIDSVPRKRLNKEDLLHDLGRKCGMTRMDAQIAYSIIKRAFRAFYFGTDLGGVPNHFLSDQLTHSSECLWVHAAQRTAQIYTAYMGVFYAVQKNLERKIKLIYKQLYDRICERTKIDDDQECTCMQCMKRINKESLKVVRVTTGIHKIHNPYEAVYKKERKEFMLEQMKEEEEKSYQENTIENKKERCSCPSLILAEKDYMYEDNAESSYIGCGQGPFDCRWFPISKEEYEADDAEIKITLPEELPCPPSSVDEECESICECTCEDCTCTADVYCGVPKSSDDDDDGYDGDADADVDADADADADADTDKSVIKYDIEEELEAESEMEFKGCRFSKRSSSKSDDEDDFD